VNKNDALVPVGEVAELALTTSPLSAAEKVQELIDALPLLAQRYEKLREICLMHVVNRPGDWALWGTERQGFKPRLNDGAASKLLSFSGIRMMDGKTTKEMITLSDGKQKYIVWHEATFVSPLGGQYSALGSCASDDPFVSSRYEYVPEEHRKVKIQIPQEDVAYDNVVKAARANCLVNGVSALLGLKNVEVDELKVLGINTDAIETVGMTDRKWEVTENQRAALLKMGATEAQIDACKNRTDVDKLFEVLKGAKGVRKEARKEEAAAGDLNAPATAAILDGLKKLAKDKSVPWSEVDTFRKVCWQESPETPISIAHATHISRWLQNPVPPEEYAAKQRAAKREPGQEG
jgi:hypothetical protein